MSTILPPYERFRKARTELNQNGLQTVAAVSAATGVSASLISDLENEFKVRFASYPNVAALAKHYGVSADFLCGLTADHHSRPAATDELGLSAEAVDRLKGVSAFQSNSLPTSPEGMVPPLVILSRLLTDSEFWRIINNLFLCTTPEAEQAMDIADIYNAAFRAAPQSLESEMTPFGDTMRDTNIASAVMHFSSVAKRAVGWNDKK